MPLSERARIEVYVPDLPKPAYQELLDSLDREFTYTFGGCTVVTGLDGTYLTHSGTRMRDRVNLIYTDVPFALQENFDTLTRYIEELKRAVFQALDEEAVLVVAWAIYHGQ